MVHKKKPFRRQRLLNDFHKEILEILDDARKKTEKILDQANKTYSELEIKMNKNANKVRSLKMRNHYKS